MSRRKDGMQDTSGHDGRTESRKEKLWEREVIEIKCGADTVLVDFKWLPSGFGTSAQFRVEETRNKEQPHLSLLSSDLSWRLRENDDHLKQWLKERYGEYQIISEIKE